MTDQQIPDSSGTSAPRPSDSSETPERADRSRLRHLLAPTIRGRFREQDVILIDLSVTGVRVRHAKRLFRGDGGKLEFVPLPGAQPVAADGAVTWCYASPDATLPDCPFVSGIEVAIPESIVQTLAQQDRATPMQELRASDRYLLTPSQPASFQSDVLVADLSMTGARICDAPAVRPGLRAVFRLTIPAAGLSLRVPARVAWSHLDRQRGTVSYVAGLEFESRDADLRAQLQRLSELQLAHIDFESLAIKQRILRTRAIERGRRLRQVAQVTVIDEPTALLVRHVRHQLRAHPEEAKRWYNKARFADADPKVREQVDPNLPYREEMLALWEYLDRTVDLWKIVRICTDEA